MKFSGKVSGEFCRPFRIFFNPFKDTLLICICVSFRSSWPESLYGQIQKCSRMAHVSSVSISNDVTIRLPIVSANADGLERGNLRPDESRMNMRTFVGRTNTSADRRVNILKQTI